MCTADDECVRPEPRENAHEELAMNALIAEFTVLRQVLRSRIDGKHRSWHFALATIGAVVSFAIHSNNFLILLAIPYVIPSIYFVYLNHGAHIGPIALYIQTTLGGEMRALARHNSLMQFERYLQQHKTRGLGRYGQYSEQYLFVIIPIAMLFLSLLGIRWSQPVVHLIGPILVWVGALCITIVQTWHVILHRKVDVLKALNQRTSAT